MTLVLHSAMFGERDGAHDFLGSSLPRDLLPSELQGLVDRPPGSVSPGTSWSPLLACAPVGDFWAVWRSIEDTAASRGGMVQSHVLLVRAADVVALTDLSPLLAALPCVVTPQKTCTPLEITPIATVGPPATSVLSAELANALTEPARKVPIVCSGQGSEFDQLLQSLWQALLPWPALRLRLTCLTAFEKSTVLQTSPDCLVFTPRELRSRWAGFPLVDTQETGASAARPAAELLLGSVRPALRSFQRYFAELPGDFSTLDKLAYAAESWDAAEKGTLDATEFPNLLRVTGLLAPQPPAAEALKALLVQRVVVAQWNSDLARSLANVDLTAFGDHAQRIGQRLEEWVAEQLAVMDAKSAGELLARAVRQHSMRWWEASLRSGLAAALRQQSAALLPQLWPWWFAERKLLLWMFPSLPSSQPTEASLVESCPRSLTMDFAEELAARALSRGWLRLHATVLARVLSAAELLRRQCALPGGPGSGLAVLVAQCPPELLLEEALRSSLPELITEVGKLAARHRSLLHALDPRIAAYREIWRIALQQGGDAWTGIADPQQILFALLDMLLDGPAVEEELLQQLSTSRQTRLLAYPRRAELWPRLPTSCRKTFLRSAASAWLEAYEQGPVADLPEDPLREVALPLALSRWSQVAMPVDLLLGFARQFPNASEAQLLPCLSKAVAAEKLPKKAAESLGQFCVKRKWSDTIKMILKHRTWTRTDLDPALKEGKALLSLWERLFFSSPPQSEHEALPSDIWDAFLEVATELYPRGPQQRDLWQRAGGKNKNIPEGDDGEEHWRGAVQSIRNGAGASAKIERLVEQMLDDYGENGKLRHLRDYFNTLRPEVDKEKSPR